MGQTSTLGPNGVFGHLTDDGLSGFDEFFNLGVGLGRGAFRILVLELDVRSVEHGILWNSDIDESELHTGQHILNSAHVDVAVNLGYLVGRFGHGVFNHRSTFESRNVRRVFGGVDAHQVATLSASFALSPTTSARGAVRITLVATLSGVGC